MQRSGIADTLHLQREEQKQPGCPLGKPPRGWPSQAWIGVVLPRRGWKPPSSLSKFQDCRQRPCACPQRLAFPCCPGPGALLPLTPQPNPRASTGPLEPAAGFCAHLPHFSCRKAGLPTLQRGRWGDTLQLGPLQLKPGGNCRTPTFLVNVATD
jgi:hypothetical protein